LANIVGDWSGMVRLMADLHDDILRVIAEFAAEDVQAAAVLRPVIDADANADCGLVHQAQVADSHEIENSTKTRVNGADFTLANGQTLGINPLSLCLG
jgi:hypothetical protein